MIQKKLSRFIFITRCNNLLKRKLYFHLVLNIRDEYFEKLFPEDRSTKNAQIKYKLKADPIPNVIYRKHLLDTYIKSVELFDSLFK